MALYSDTLLPVDARYFLPKSASSFLRLKSTQVNWKMLQLTLLLVYKFVQFGQFKEKTVKIKKQYFDYCFQQQFFTGDSIRFA